MKRLIFIFVLVLCIPMLLAAKEIAPLQPDTTILVNNKRIEINESVERMKIKVYEITSTDEIVEDELVFEGHYKDGQSYERRRYANAITIPLPSWDRNFSAHWAGFGMGFANVADGNFNVNDIDGVSLNSGKSLEYNLNFLEKSFRLTKQYNWAIVTGMGMRWSRYRLDENKYFKEIDGITDLRPAPDGMIYTSSKLNITSLTIPVLLEWQSKSRRHDPFFISAGVVGVIKTISSSKVSYKDDSGKKHKEKMDAGMNIRPVTIDFLVQAGYDWIGVYLKYSPVGLFESDKGPKIHPVSIGLHLHL
ncbi:PorT family protein [Parabacteroides sp. OttesenSCG-928-G21]|nr:PorT family protein [Parabacteroides sp. OttesenSCG-928-G21]